MDVVHLHVPSNVRSEHPPEVPGNEYHALAESVSYGDAFRHPKFSKPGLIDHAEFERVVTARISAVRKYSYAIPNEAALQTLADHAPLIEIGAGSGYWAYLLRERRVDILAYDTTPPVGNHKNFYFTEYNPDRTVKVKHQAWTKVSRGGVGKVREHPNRTLFLCWPPPQHPMALKAASAYQGDTVIVIGEVFGSVTGNLQFWAHLSAFFMPVKEVAIPRWCLAHDRMIVWKRINRS